LVLAALVELAGHLMLGQMALILYFLLLHQMAEVPVVEVGHRLRQGLLVVLVVVAVDITTPS
jgi:acyl-[acyl carrier protein]--UDP-N-acetylglucosamine O-acyltransferase